MPVESDKIVVKIIHSKAERNQSRSIRLEVFVREQKVAPEIEYDEYEASSTHILALLNNQAVGTARWRETPDGYKLERFAVISTVRDRGIGAAMVNFILTQLDRAQNIYLNSQVSAIGFYRRLGFQEEGPIFYEADIPHRKMFLSE